MLVQRIKAETRTAGGVLLPETAVKELNEAKVLAVGPGALDKEGKRMPMSVQSGDKVLIPQVGLWISMKTGKSSVDADGRYQFGGSPIKVGEEEFSLFRDHE